MNNWDRYYDIIREIPSGSVLTYGDVARLAGKPNGAREVGWALGSLPPDSDVPWWRVVNAAGAISLRPLSSDLQAELLRAEGIPVDTAGRLALAQHRWGGSETQLAGT
jgi:methylated-DNA-protein-cysteine methyltransferase-like protein